jgi:hypothetical protein
MTKKQKLAARIKQLRVEAVLDGSTLKANTDWSKEIKELAGLPGPGKHKYLVMFLVKISPGHHSLAANLLYAYPLYNECQGVEAALDTALRLHLGKRRELPWQAHYFTIVPLGSREVRDATLRKVLDAVIATPGPAQGSYTL